MRIMTIVRATRVISNTGLRYRIRRMRYQSKRMRYVPPILFVAVVVVSLVLILRLRTLLSGAVSFFQLNPPPPLQPLALSKYPTLLNLNFTWISNNEDLCHQDQNGSEHRHILPIIIPSSRYNLAKRLTIRKTWGSLRTYKNWDVRLIFLLGQADPRSERSQFKGQLQDEENRLRDEQTLFQDLVIGSFIDSYRNLSLKHLMGYKWILNFCREAQFIWKVDDDVFFDIMYWLDWHSDELKKVSKNENHTLPQLICSSYKRNEPIRNKTRELGHWFVSYEEWPGRLYPDYCIGFAYAINRDFMEKIYAVSNSRKMFWIDDIYVTGVLREVAEKTFNISPKIKEIGNESRYEEGQYYSMCKNRTYHFKMEFKSIILIKMFIPEYMMCFWNRTLYDRETLQGKSYLEDVSYQRFSKEIRLNDFYDY